MRTQLVSGRRRAGRFCSGDGLQWKGWGGGSAVNLGERLPKPGLPNTPVFPLEPVQPPNRHKGRF